MLSPEVDSASYLQKEETKKKKKTKRFEYYAEDKFMQSVSITTSRSDLAPPSTTFANFRAPQRHQFFDRQEQYQHEAQAIKAPMAREEVHKHSGVSFINGWREKTTKETYI